MGPPMDKNLVFIEDGVEFMKLCVDITVYWRGSAFDHAPGILAFHDEAARLIGPRVKQYRTGEMERSSPVAADTFDLLRAWLEGGDRSQDMFTLMLETSDVPDLRSDCAFVFEADELVDDPAGALQLSLPVAFVEESPNAMVDLARKLVDGLDFHSGHGGFTLNWDPLGEFNVPAQRAMAALARRFPAIDLPDTGSTLLAIPTGMKRSNWLTLLGDSLLARGAPESFGVDGRYVVRLPHGVLIQAGDAPTVGDVNHQDDVSLYRAVGRAVAPFRSKEHPPLLNGPRGIPDDDATEEWLAYFES